MLGDLTGKHAIVTGAGSGIGTGIASVMTSQGASVAIADLNEEASHKTSHQIEGDTMPLGMDEHVQPYLDSLAYRFDTADGSVVFTGDTQPCQNVIQLAKGADIMLCMCWDNQDIMDKNGEANRQCGTTGAAKMAQEAGVKKLVLVHIGPHLSSHGPMEKGIGEIESLYDGEVIFSDELMSFSI